MAWEGWGRGWWGVGVGEQQGVFQEGSGGGAAAGEKKEGEEEEMEGEKGGKREEGSVEGRAKDGGERES